MYFNTLWLINIIETNTQACILYFEFKMKSDAKELKPRHLHIFYLT